MDLPNRNNRPPRSRPGPKPGGNRRTLTDQEAAILWQEMRRDLTSMGREARTLAELRLERGRVAAARGGLNAVFAAWLTWVAVVASAVAAVLLVLGLSGAVTALAGETPWVGRLVVGVVFLIAGGAAFLVSRRRLDRAAVERIRKRFGAAAPAPSSSEQPHPQASPHAG